MITSDGFEWTEDVFASNKVFHLERTGVNNQARVAAALKLLPGRPLLKHQTEVLQNLFSVITSHLPHYFGWLVVSNGGKVRDSRIVRHNGLWRSLGKRTPQLPEGQQTSEYVHEYEGCVQYFGAVRLNNFDAAQLTNFLLHSKSSHLILGGSELSIDDFLTKGWQDNSSKFPSEFLNLVEREDIFCLAPLGEFDDIEGGAVALARPDILERCFKE